ncbi:GSCFA domain-containing protein [Winogradskyella costae]|uniref:GSCFA domain-containing protein n=1 Tax=Winogradskyella costae TaxID=2697008 RepID=UPI0015CDC7E9|nr:GSCFA domain-containing protein [Winogradskyella costae]
MNLQTQIPLKLQKHNQIDYISKVLLLGSCFSENISEKFNYFKFQSIVNPFGILFHPLAIEHLITRAINKDYYSEDDLYFHNEQWFCLDAHSKLNKTSKDELLSVLNSQIDETHNNLVNTSHVIITLGTSWVYRHIESDNVVANCHKLPQKQFLKELLAVDTITESLQAIIALVRSVNPEVSFLFTVSPVRHLKDGFVENTQSKAHLVTAIHKVIEPRNGIYYFPSYEIMMDELRDYRFYNPDMLHPNDVAIQYIWDKFKKVWLSAEALQTLDMVAAIQTKKSHRPFNINSEAHQKFLSKLQLEVEGVCAKFPHISF